LPQACPQRMQIPTEGQLLGGRYRVISTLASGGFGQTYVAADTHRPGSPRCVVKQLKPLNTNEEVLKQARRLFAIEAETLERLGHHPQIPRLLAYFEEGDEFYLVMEYIDGHPLAQEMSPGQRWSEIQVCQMLREVLGILEFVHGNGVIHRDIKPENLIRRASDQKLVLVDFGAVKQVRVQVPGQTATIFTIPVGTLGYLPSEQRDGHPRFNSDIYALGMTAVQALTGFNPGQIRSDPETLERVWEPYADASPALKAIVSRMVRFLFRERYQTVGDILADLAPLMQQQARTEIVTQPPSVETVRLPSEPLPPPSAPSPEPVLPIAEAPLVAAEGSNGSASVTYPHYAPAPNSGPPAITASMAPVYSNANAQPSYPPTQVIPLSPATIPDSRPSRLPRRKLWLWTGILLVGAAAIGSFNLVQQRMQQQAYAAAQTALDQANVLQTESEFDACVQQANQVPSDYPELYEPAQVLVNDCQLALAQQLATAGRYKDAITTASQVSASSSAYDAAQTNITQWSERILALAADRLNQQGKLDEAIALAEAIPRSSSVYSKAQEQISQWRTDWPKYQKQFDAAKQAQSEGRWQAAIDAANQLPNTPYWQQQAKPILDKAQSELNKRAAPPPAPVRSNPAPSVSEAPVYSEPTYSEPAYQEPVYSDPAQEPVYSAPPAYEPPAPAPAPPPVEVNDCPPGVQPPCV
jgi:serine/threonine protein kinase, bacterial